MTSSKPCDKTELVLRAEKHGAWTEGLRRHVAGSGSAGGCPTCSDALLVERMLGGEARATLTVAPLHDAGSVWRRAEAERRRAMVRRATWPIRAVRRLALAAGVVIGGWVVVRVAPTALDAVGRLGGSVDLAAGLSTESWILVATLVSLLAVVSGVYLAWSES